MDAYLWDEFAKVALQACIQMAFVNPEAQAAIYADELLKERLKRYPIEEIKVRTCTGR
jgi:hypothetical protein